jgi:hypothetical protein
MGDTAYSILELGLHCAKHHVTLIAPFRLDSMIHQPPQARTKHTIGRPRVVGKRLPSLEKVLQDPQTVWQRITVDWYGEGKRALEICTGTALWYRYGSDPLPIRWVLTRDPDGKRPPKGLVSTDQNQPAEEIVLDFMKRWSLETTFEESRAYLGIETQRQWSDLAIERTTPLLFGLFSLIALFGHALHPDGHIPVAQVAWYRKQVATFHDLLAAVRRHLWGNFTFPHLPMTLMSFYCLVLPFTSLLMLLVTEKIVQSRAKERAKKTRLCYTTFCCESRASEPSTSAPEPLSTPWNIPPISCYSSCCGGCGRS